MKVKGAIALVTGANRGLGRAYAQALLDAGAAKVYAAARDPSTVSQPGVTPIRLDVTNAAEVAAVAREYPDINLVINNAGIARPSAFLGDGAVAAIREQFDTNFFGMLAMSRAFAPVLKANGGGALVNMLSALSWVNLTALDGYCASKAAAWSLTNGLRAELKPQGTLVVGVHAAFIDTDMASSVTTPKISPQDVARQVVEAIEAGREEVFADDTSRYLKAHLSDEAGVYLKEAGK